MTNAHIRYFIGDWVPLGAIRVAKALLDVIRSASFEFIDYSWPQGMQLKGWQADGVRESRENNWQSFVSSLQGNGLLGVGEKELLFPQHMKLDIQTLYLSYGYCLALACHNKQCVSILDWGGGTGNYYLVSRKLMPNVSMTYHCADLSSVCVAGRELLPEVTFDENETWKEKKYDFVFSSSSLHYLEDWHTTLAALIQSSKQYLYVTRMPFVVTGKSFVMIQRAAMYETEYLGWVLNRQEFIRFVEQRGMKLVQQFVNHKGPQIAKAPEKNLYMGFLFEK